MAEGWLKPHLMLCMAHCAGMLGSREGLLRIRGGSPFGQGRASSGLGEGLLGSGARKVCGRGWGSPVWIRARCHQPNLVSVFDCGFP